MIMLNESPCEHGEAVRATRTFGSSLLRACTVCGRSAGTVSLRPDGRPDLQIVKETEDAAC